ncbi:MAG: hypothetical protein R3F59_19860 [Myxococcota bacterium]
MAQVHRGDWFAVRDSMRAKLEVMLERATSTRRTGRRGDGAARRSRGDAHPDVGEYDLLVVGNRERRAWRGSCSAPWATRWRAAARATW